MKKTILSFLLVAATSTALFAQVSIGPKIGLGISNFKDTKVPSGSSSSSFSSILTPQVGAVLNIQLGEHFAIRPELLYLQRGTKQNLNTGGTYTARLSYIELPVNIAAGLNVGPGKLEVFAGPSLGFVLGGKYKFEGNGQTKTGKIKAQDRPDNYTGSDAFTNGINFSLNFGLDYKFNNGFLIQVGYNLGLTNINPHYDNSDDETKRKDLVTKASAVTFGVGYLFGGKK